MKGGFSSAITVEWPAMDNVARLKDDQLLARMQAPPDLCDGVQSLAYWQRRQRHLPRYRLAARGEAARMVVVWERRVRAALIQQRGVPITARLRGARLIAATRLRRWIRRAGFVLAATIAVMVLLAPALLAMDLLLQIV
jgi:hypothetical protein